MPSRGFGFKSRQPLNGLDFRQDEAWIEPTVRFLTDHGIYHKVEVQQVAQWEAEHAEIHRIKDEQETEERSRRGHPVPHRVKLGNGREGIRWS